MDLGTIFEKYTKKDCFFLSKVTFLQSLILISVQDKTICQTPIMMFCNANINRQIILSFPTYSKEDMFQWINYYSIFKIL